MALDRGARTRAVPRSAADALVSLMELAVTLGSGMWASRADLGIRKNLLEALR
jgi:hypothetical protein